MKIQHNTNKPGLPRRHRRRQARQNLDQKAETKFSSYIYGDRSESPVTTTYARLGQEQRKGRGLVSGSIQSAHSAKSS
jgi:hypothetical protein